MNHIGAFFFRQAPPSTSSPSFQAMSSKLLVERGARVVGSGVAHLTEMDPRHTTSQGSQLRPLAELSGFKSQPIFWPMFTFNQLTPFLLFFVSIYVFISTSQHDFTILLHFDLVFGIILVPALVFTFEEQSFCIPRGFIFILPHCIPVLCSSSNLEDSAGGNMSKIALTTPTP